MDGCLDSLKVVNNVLKWVGITQTGPAWIQASPKGTVLGPLLFLAYLNDLPEDLQCLVRLFASDYAIYKKNNCPDDAELLQKDLESISA